MSIGYVPQKVKQARRYRRMRKKYKNFSCLTCAYGGKCSLKVFPSPIGGIFITKDVIEFCKCWKASEEAKKGHKVITCPVEHKEKKTLKKIISKFLMTDLERDTLKSVSFHI